MSSQSAALSALGPLFQVTENLVTVKSGAVSGVIAKANPLRWALLIGMPNQSTQPSAIALSQGALVSGGGIILGAGSQATGPAPLPFQLNFRQHGPLVQQEWIGGAPGGAVMQQDTVWTVYEVLFVPG